MKVQKVLTSLILGAPRTIHGHKEITIEIVFIRDTWSRDLQGEMGQPYKKGRWGHLFLNGIYWGMFQIDERAEASYGESYFGGDREDYDVVKSYGGVTDGDRKSYERLWRKWQQGFKKQ